MGTSPAVQTSRGSIHPTCPGPQVHVPSRQLHTPVCCMLSVHTATHGVLAKSYRTQAQWHRPERWLAGVQSPHPSLTPVLPLDRWGPALTAGFRPSLSRVFLLRGPSMVGTAAELPSVQVHGLVGLRGQHWSDIAQRSSAQAPCHSLEPTGPSLPSPHAATGRRTQQCWARPGREGPEAAESSPTLRTAPPSSF